MAFRGLHGLVSRVSAARGASRANITRLARPDAGSAGHADAMGAAGGAPATAPANGAAVRRQSVRVSKPLMSASRQAINEFRAEDCRAGRAWYMMSAGMATAVALAGAVSIVDHHVNAEAAVDEAGAGSDGDEPALRVFTRKEVAEHVTEDTRILVTYGRNVYDVTDFVPGHPGGQARILMAKGGPVEPFWALYRQHLTPQVQEILAGMKVGVLDKSEEDVEEISDANDPFSGDPRDRHPGLIVRQAKPFNAETPMNLITDSYTTPNALWYVRHHHPVPDIDDKSFELALAAEAGPLKGASASLSVDEIKARFPKREVTVTLQCGGNRRSEYDRVRKAQGLPWTAGAISTATWGGVFLKDLLVAMGVPADARAAREAGIHHVQFVGADEPYDASVGVELALNSDREVLVAYEMNGEPLPREHGAPLRVVVPGAIGARSVKWVKKIVASHEESHSNWQRGLPYKMTPPGLLDLADADPEVLPPVCDLPVQSAICLPAVGETVEVEPAGDGKPATVHVEGYAWSGGGRNILRVDVSADGGASWHTASVKHGGDQPAGRAWAWTLWQADVPVSSEVAKKGGGLSLVSKAVDASGNTQPADVADTWNARGILNNCYSRVGVVVEADE
mmetsp:Transcript_3839/g.14271  ORF Transcript_3839/g.14271 Transcript_3839/m.14271 type:complete len:623 (-) Transcript_3839:759-2627(-)